MNTAALLAKMSDEYLIAALYAQRNPLTATPAEDELIKRFERTLDELSEKSAYAQVLINEYDFSEYADREETSRLRRLLDFATGICDRVFDADDAKAVLNAHPASFKDTAAMLSLLNQHEIYTPEQLETLLSTAQPE